MARRGSHFSGRGLSRILRIDFVITELFVGGAERCLTNLALGCHRAGDEVRVATIGNLPQGPQAKFVERLQAAQIEVYSCQCDSVLALPTALRRLNRWLAVNPPQVLQSMLFHANVLAAWTRNPAGKTIKVGGARVVEPSSWRSGVERWSMKRMQAMVCVSDSVEQALRAQGNRSIPLPVIGNSIDLKVVDQKPVADWSTVAPGIMQAGEQVLLFVGRLHPQKGLETLLEALPPLLEKYPEMRVVFVGDGPLRQWLNEQASQLGDNRLVVLGWRRDAMSLIKACHMLVLPSRYEGMPNVIMEAMAASKPVAATRVEGVGELLREGVVDQTCEARSVDQLRGLIDKLWSDPNRCQWIGQRNREIIAAHHGVEAMVQAYRDLYESLRQTRTSH